MSSKLYLPVLLLLCISCQKSLKDLPVFDKNVAYESIRHQLEMGPRVPNSTGHEECKNWIAGQLQALGFQVKISPFTARTFTSVPMNVANVTGAYKPELTKRIVLATHYDTRPIAENDKDISTMMKPIAGADDGASGVAVLLEIAKIIKQKPIQNFGIDFVFLDASDQGDDTGMNVYSWGLGSQEWSTQVAISKKPKPEYCIFINMVGSKELRITQEGGSMRFAKELLIKIFAQAKTLGYEKYFPQIESRAIVEDHVFSFEHLDIPCILLMNNPEGSNNGIPPYMHTHQDNLEIVDPESLYKVGHLLL